MKIKLNRLLDFINKLTDKQYQIILVLLVLISFGQMLQMNVWQDDQALFVKLVDVNKSVGFFGAGPFGSGVYRFAATPFIPIYWLFGFNTIAFFAFLLILYAVTTLTLYKVFSLILGKPAGRIAALFYGAGYITSDSFWRMANSATTSLSIILTSISVAMYWQYYKFQKIKYYLGALLFYIISCEIAVARVHYFFAVLVVFEALFLISKKSILKSLTFSLLRLTPFFYFFYKTFVIGADQRSGEVRNLVNSLLHGQAYLLFGFFSSLANLIFPDWASSSVVEILLGGQQSPHSSPLFIYIVLFVISSLFFYIIFSKKRNHFLWAGIFSLLSLILIILSKRIFSNQILNATQSQIFLAALGINIFLYGISAAIILKKLKKEFIFLSLWLIGNIAAYWAYYPTLSYETINRYLAHSFVAYVGILGIIYFLLPRKSLIGRVGLIAIFIFLIGNLFHNISYQNHILITRSYPTKFFYNQLKTYLPVIKKGDILYFDISPDVYIAYTDAIAAAMIPNTGSFAWRYGIDRYDFELVNSYEEMLKKMEETKTGPEQVHSFFYASSGLVDTTVDVRQYLKKKILDSLIDQKYPLVSLAQISKKDQATIYTQPDIDVVLSEQIPNSVPVDVSVDISASTIKVQNSIFPLFKDSKADVSELIKDQDLQILAIEYKNFMESFGRETKVTVSSDWQDRVAPHLTDQNSETVWQSDRVLWNNKQATITLSLAQVEIIDRVVWINGFANNTPTDYKIEVSNDGQNWNEVKHVNLYRRISDIVPVIDRFDSVEAQYVRMVINDTVSDSPGVAEIWVVPTRFKDIDIQNVSKFLANPFTKVENLDHFNKIMTALENTGKVRLSWMNDKYSTWQSDTKTQFKLVFNGQRQLFKMTIPAGGTRLSKLRLSDFNIPGEITLYSITVSNPDINK